MAVITSTETTPPPTIIPPPVTTPPPTVTTETICSTGEQFSATTGLPCTTFITSPTSSVSQTAQSSNCTLTQTLKQGSKGTEVKCLQTKLNLLVDGIFGKKTKATVILFQKAHNLTPDGVVGKKTRGEMNG